jgi:hypothetical protein
MTMASMDRDRIERLAEQYGTADVSADIERADYDDRIVAEPMVTTSLRLPKSTMDALRAVAAEERTRPTALMREWIEQHLSARALPAHEVVIPVSAVRDLVTEILGALGDRCAGSTQPFGWHTGAPLVAHHPPRVAGRRRAGQLV